ncbi:unnamed protein product [Adineta steineri]|uniref:Uncharacterized protein n=2 Tax=Adineta steineri TaxID=433720 RepID=A0A819FHF1_9BILA|nr:unnamed protein product [Adineta steineri]CAF3868888.1 unnamed protein product [Adineta steineri]
MDVLELPRPVINFLRTMAKESCRYVLSWDIFGGTDTVTLTLTWKLIDNDEYHPSILKSSQQHINNDSLSSPRRSRRDENSSTSTINYISTGKNHLEENNLTLNKQIVSSSQQQVSNLKRSSIINQQQNTSDPIYANLYPMKSTMHRTLYSSLNKNSSLSTSHIHHPSCESPRLRKPKPTIPIVSHMISKLTRTNRIITSNDTIVGNDDDDDTLDPWVKRFESLFENNTNEIIDQSKDRINELGVTSGKVKFKRKPDYF